MGTPASTLRLVPLLGLMTVTDAVAQVAPPPPNAVTAAQAAAQVPPAAPAWFRPHYLSLLGAPLPSIVHKPIAPDAVVPRNETDPDGTGILGTLNLSGPTATSANAFFMPLGTNGRSCVTCHAPADAFGLSTTDIRRRYAATLGTDPLFDPVDGATCPSNVPANLTSGSLVGGLVGQSRPVLGGLLGALDPDSPNSPFYLLLRKGLIRIPLPVPANADFTIQVVQDPYNCNTNPAYNAVVDPVTKTSSRIVSVYRRPPMASNLKFKVQAADNTQPPGFPPLDPLTLTPLPTDAAGAVENGMIMWDGREPTLASQAIDATLGHAQATMAPTPAQVAQIVAFEQGLYSAQSHDNGAGSLTAGGALGGPTQLAAQAAGVLPSAAAPEGINIFDAWYPSGAGQAAQRASIYRGQQIFNNKPFSVTNVAGFNNATLLGITNASPQSPQEHCSTCHGQVNAGTDPLPIGAHDIGVGGDATSFGGPQPAGDMPVFRITCNAGSQTPFNGSVVLTNDPGKALVTGKCADVGRFTTAQIRGLAARAPYFSDGSAARLSDVVTFYDKRFGIGLSTQEQADLVNFLGSL